MGAALGLAAVGLLHVNNYQDSAADRARGVRTLALALGDRGSRAYLVAVYALAFATWAVAATLSALPLWLAFLPAVAALPAAGLVRRLLTAPDPATLVPARMQAAATHLVFGVLICLALGLSMAL
jgi:1,4-dihydroxy-2-naphthoate octaprenyltransferase